jgi:hypothetical protein
MKFEKIVASVFYADIKDSLKLFVDCLAFSVAHEDLTPGASFYVMRKDGLDIMVFQDPKQAAIDYPEFRLVTKNIEDVYRKVAATHPELLHPNLNKITLRAWGAKEFAIKDAQVGFRIQEWQ